MEKRKFTFCVKHEVFTFVMKSFGLASSLPVLLLFFFSPLRAEVHISGVLEMEDGDPVADVMVVLNDGEYVAYTDENGYYSFSVPEGGDYVLKPVKEDEVGLGVTGFDAILLTWHILGTQFLTSPIKQFAADVNASGSLSTLDITIIFKMALGEINAFPNKKPWHFFYFGDEGNYLQEVSFPNLTADVSWGDFIVVKTGDLNDSAAQNLGMAVEDHSEDLLLVRIEDRYFSEGETVEVNFAVEEGKVLGYQFTITFDAGVLELEDLIPGVAQDDNFGTQWVADGVLTTAWTGSDVTDLSDRDLFGLVFKARGSGWLSDFLNLNSAYTLAEAYNGSGEIIPIKLDVSSAKVNLENFKLYQNSPNPFVGSTQIAFDLPQGGLVKLVVVDAAGRVIYRFQDVYPQGHHLIELADLQGEGQLYYRLETEYAAEVKGMWQLYDR